jgi:nucleoside-diphosphate-sugar epimerase
LAARGAEVLATSRHAEGLMDLPGVTPLRLDAGDERSLAGLAERVRDGVAVLHSVPVLAGPEDPTRRLLRALGGRPARMVYLSTTSVYGAQKVVDENTPVMPGSEQARLRVRAEQLVMGGEWPSMVLRPAAIYGPGRGVQVSIPRGDFRLMGSGENYVSRIHVDDLAAMAEAALLCDAGGAWPVADDEPARSREVAEFVCGLLGCVMPVTARAGELHETRSADRRVDGRAARALLDVQLRYSSFRSGIPASL